MWTSPGLTKLERVFGGDVSRATYSSGQSDPPHNSERYLFEVTGLQAPSKLKG